MRRLLPDRAYEELIRQAAQVEVLHNDDTTIKILDFTDDARAEALRHFPRNSRESD